MSITTSNLQVTFASPMRRFVIALVSGLLATAFLYYYIDKTLLESSGGERIPVLVATKVLRPGERIEAQGVAVQLVPRAYIHANSVRRDDQDKVFSRQVYRHVAANQPILWSDFDPPESERSTMVALGKGMRAVAMPMGEHLRKAHILKMGDAVDVIFNFSLPQGNIALTMFQRVVVIDLRDDVVVLALTPEQSEELAFSQGHGTPMLVLRNREDTEKTELKQVTFSNLLKGSVDLRTVPVSSSPSPQKTQALMQLIEQAKKRNDKP